MQPLPLRERAAGWRAWERAGKGLGEVGVAAKGRTGVQEGARAKEGQREVWTRMEGLQSQVSADFFFFFN